MHPVTDVELADSVRSLALADRLARQAIEALAGLVAPAGYRVDNRVGESEIAQPAEDPAATDPGPAAVQPRYSFATVVVLDAVLDLLIARPAWMGKADRDRVVGRLGWLLDQDPEVPDPLHPTVSELQPALKLLRYAMLCQALAKLLVWRPADDDLSRKGDQAREAATATAVARLPQLSQALIAEANAVPDGAASDLHPYIVYCVSSALGWIQEEPWRPHGVDTSTTADAHACATQLWLHSKTRVEHLIAQHAMGTLGARDTVACALYAGTAALQERRHHLEALVKGAVDERHSVGGWQQGRVVAQHEGQDGATVTLAVPAWEILRTLGRIATASLDDRDDPVPTCRSELIDAVVDALPAAEAAFIEDDGVTGWPGEHPYRDRLIDAWPTACVLGMAVTTYDVVERVDRHQVLAKLNGTSSSTRWPEWLEWESYRTNEPEEDAKILEFIHEEIVAPRIGLASGAARETTVALLFGPPGTTKTTIARSAANGLGWPIVSLSPGTFIQDGLEKIEKRANWVFSRLQKLQRAVVIFDECDELFRERKPDPKNEPVRQVSAFMTASMLPKLQDLHDRSSIVVFICTNFLDSMDPAIRRPGRVDWLIAVSPPDEPQRRRTIELELRKAGVELDGNQHEAWDVAMDTLAKGTDNLIRGEVVTLAQQLAAATFSDTSKALQTASEIAKSVPEVLRTIKPTSDEYTKFLSSREVMSAPHRKATQRRKDSHA